MSKLKDIFYPPFSETDAFALLVSLLLPILLKITNFFTLDLFLDELGLRTEVLIFATVIIFWAYLVIKNILVKKEMSLQEKNTMAIYFYLIVGFLTLWSAIEFLLIPVSSLNALSLFDFVNMSIAIFLFFRSLISVASLRVAKDYKDMLVSQVKDDQAGLVEVVFLIIVASIVYLLIQFHYSIAYSILLTYFYSSSILNFYKKVVIKN